MYKCEFHEVTCSKGCIYCCTQRTARGTENNSFCHAMRCTSTICKALKVLEGENRFDFGKVAACWSTKLFMYHVSFVACCRKMWGIFIISYLPVSSVLKKKWYPKVCRRKFKKGSVVTQALQPEQRVNRVKLPSSAWLYMG